MTNEAIRAVGYVRVSTQDQATEGFSLPNQRRRIGAYCAAQGWHLQEVFADEGISGSDVDRPAFKEMLEKALSGGVDRIVFLKLDRLGRCAWQLGEVRQRLESSGVGLVSIVEQFDSATSIGRFFWTLLAAFAEFERDVIRERAASGLAEKASRGHGWITGRVPFGYRLDGTDLVVHEEEAEAVRSIFRSMARGATTSQCVRHLSGSGREWSRSAVRRIVRNPLYKGEYRSLDRYKVTSPAIVSRSLWTRAQTALRTPPM
ncbi:MAG: recombinase family protein [Actinobacteria bacterium]|nr:recombinase family protein [Actinomycetota bacterium]